MAAEKEDIGRQWASVAAARQKWFEKTVAWTRAATEMILEAARIGPGMRVLDVAGGSGDPALALAAAVGPEGHVTATDLVPELLAIAEQNARRRGLTNMTFQPADAEALPFPDRSFDAVTCRFGVMFFPHTGRALREVYRVLKPEGRGVFIAWGPWERNPLWAATVGIFLKYVPTPPDSGVFSPFSFAEPGKLAAALEGAGFGQVREELRSIPWPWPGPAEELWQYLQESAAPMRPLFEGVAAEKREQAHREVLAALRTYQQGQQVDCGALLVLASGGRS